MSSSVAYDFSHELMEILEGSQGVERLFHGTFDDVGNCVKDGINAAVGFVASKAQWDYFNFKWQDALDRAGIEYLHTAKYLNEFPLIGGSGITDDDIANILAPFIQVVQDVIFNPPPKVAKPGFPVCVITRCDAYDQLTGDEKKYVRVPELNSFELAVGLACLQIRDGLSDANPMAIQMDESEDAPRLFDRYLALKRENETLKKYLGGICFADDKKLRSIQAADMLGNLTLKAWRNKQSGKDLPRAFKELVFVDGGKRLKLSYLVCGLDFLRGLAADRKARRDKMMMPQP